MNRRYCIITQDMKDPKSLKHRNYTWSTSPRLAREAIVGKGITRRKNIKVVSILRKNILQV